MTSIKNRLLMLERRLLSLFPRWPSDDDGFLAALGVDLHKYERKNHDGGVGFDVLAALNAIAADVWRDGT